MKGLIIFKGKYGATRQYAEWLATELALPAFHPDNFRKEKIFNCDYVVIGSSVYIGKLQIKNWIKQHVTELLSKKIFLFIVSGTPPDEKEKLELYVQGSVPPEIRRQCQVYFLPGKLVYQHLSWSDKFMLRMGAMLTKEKETKKKMLTDYNNVKKENLDALVQDIKKYSGSAKKSMLQS